MVSDGRVFFVAGLNNVRHPGAGTQDPVLLDSERRILNEAIALGRLQLAGERPQRTREEFFAMLQRCHSRTDPHITLSFPSFDFLSERDGFPSSTLLRRLPFQSSGDADSTYQHLIEATGRRASDSSLLDRR